MANGNGNGDGQQRGQMRWLTVTETAMADDKSNSNGWQQRQQRWVTATATAMATGTAMAMESAMATATTTAMAITMAMATARATMTKGGLPLHVPAMCSTVAGATPCLHPNGHKGVCNHQNCIMGVTLQRVLLPYKEEGSWQLTMDFLFFFTTTVLFTEQPSVCPPHYWGTQEPCQPIDALSPPLLFHIFAKEKLSNNSHFITLQIDGQSPNLFNSNYITEAKKCHLITSPTRILIQTHHQ
jgi:hypothetical protein